MASKLFTAKTSSFLDLAAIINNGQEFHNSTKSFRGVHWDSDHASLPGKGKMPEAEWNTLKRLHDQNGIDYVVYSYYTPIAYRTTNGVWHMPSVRYSNTTSQHQGKISAAAHQLMIQKGIAA